MIAPTVFLLSLALRSGGRCPRLTAELLAARLSGGDAGPNAFTAFELGEGRHYSSDPLSVWRRQIELQRLQRLDGRRRDIPCLSRGRLCRGRDIGRRRAWTRATGIRTTACRELGVACRSHAILGTEHTIILMACV